MLIQGPVLEIDAFWADNKHFPSEENPDSKIGQVFHSGYTGKYHHLGWMDLVQLKELISKHSISHIVLKNLDILGKVAMVSQEVKVCTMYLHKSGRIFKTKPTTKYLVHCKPLFHTVEFGGWEMSADDDFIHTRAIEYMIYLLYRTKVNSVSYSTNKVISTVYFDSEGKHHISTEKIIQR